MKKIVAIILVLAAISSSVFTASAADVSALCAVTIETDNGNILYEKNAHTKKGPASTTKIMTAIVAIENCPIDTEIKIPSEAVGIEGSSIYLKNNEVLTLEQLLYALLLQSANDAATAIAIAVAGSTESFVEIMNEKVKELGLQNTHFSNPHGLYEDDHYTTAYDLAFITRYALQNETFSKIVSTKTAKIPCGENGLRVLVNHNKLLSSYEGCIGVKTGYTKQCGRCLVSAAKKDGVTVIAVTLNAPNDWEDHRRLLDEAFEKLTKVTLALPGSLSFDVPVTGGAKNCVSAVNKDSLAFTCIKSNLNITHEVILERFLFAPVEKNTVLGEVVFYNNKEEIGRVKLYSGESVNKLVRKKTFFDRIGEIFSK